MTALDRAAKAAWDENRRRCEIEAKEAGFVLDEWENEPEALREDWRALTRAVLMAVQDLPVSLLEGAAKAAYGADALDHEVMNFDSAWVACIDAILAEETK